MLRRIPLNQGITWEPTRKTTPTMRQLSDLVKSRRKLKPIKSFFPCLIYEMSAYSFRISQIHASPDLYSSGILWSHPVRYPLDPNKQIFTWTTLRKKLVHSFCNSLKIRVYPWPSCTGNTTRLRSRFAIGNYVNQRLLKPVHD